MPVDERKIVYSHEEIVEILQRKHPDVKIIESNMNKFKVVLYVEALKWEIQYLLWFWVLCICY